MAPQICPCHNLQNLGMFLSMAKEILEMQLRIMRLGEIMLDFLGATSVITMVLLQQESKYHSKGEAGMIGGRGCEPRSIGDFQNLERQGNGLSHGASRRNHPAFIQSKSQCALLRLMSHQTIR